MCVYSLYPYIKVYLHKRYKSPMLLIQCLAHQQRGNRTRTIEIRRLCFCKRKSAKIMNVHR